jgi:esterase/lipase
MFSNPYTRNVEGIFDYPSLDSPLAFPEYIAHCRSLIQARRLDLQLPPANTTAAQIIDANSPFELYPDRPLLSDNGQRLKYGVLLLHGLLDSPFAVKDLGNYLQANGILCKSILLPGHGTQAADLLSISQQDWIKAAKYGMDNLGKEVEHLYLLGFSTGAALAAYHALQNKNIAGIILLAPAIQIKVPMNYLVIWRYLKKYLHLNHNQWIYKKNEIDYAKYISIPFNAVNQVAALTKEIKILRQDHSLDCPIFMAVSQEDETISAAQAIDFFSSFHHKISKLILYAADTNAYANKLKGDSDSRIVMRSTHYPTLNIREFSHVSLPFRPNNPHYGQHGNYEYASHIHNKGFIYGAYQPIKFDIRAKLQQLKLINDSWRTLTYNPDFDYLAAEIKNFILHPSPA